MKHVLWQNKSTCFARCKAVRPGHSVWPKIRLTESGTDQITILRCFLSFKTVIISRNNIVFKIKFSQPKNGHPSRARSLVPRTSSCHTCTLRMSHGGSRGNKPDPVARGEGAAKEPSAGPSPPDSGWAGAQGRRGAGGRGAQKSCSLGGGAGRSKKVGGALYIR